jgi:ribosomal protein S18 acetylase RimI-like enzyme
MAILSDAPVSPAQIEPANWRDLNALRQLETICFPKDAWPLLDLLGVLTFPNVIRLRAVINGRMIGFIAGDIKTSENLAWIATIAVLPEYRGRGIGRDLLTACENQLKVPLVRLNVRLSNQPAIRLYRKAGYRDAGIWPIYYQDGEDALIMEKQL